MGIASLTLGVVALCTWIIPPLGIIIGVIGLILGVLALVAKKQQRRAIAGLIMCFIGVILSIGVVVGIVAGGLILEQFMYEYFGY